MSILDILAGRQPLCKSKQRNVPVDSLLVDMMNTPHGPNEHRIPVASYALDGDVFLPPNKDNDAENEIRTVTTITSDGVTRFQILRTNNTQQNDVIEISVQTSANCHIQLFEGNAPLTAIRYVQTNQLFSEPGKIINSSLYLFCAEPSIVLQVEVRSLPVK